MSKVPIVDCIRCKRHVAAFNFSWHLWSQHRILVDNEQYTKVYWWAVREGRVTA